MKVNYLLKLAIQNKALRVMALLLLTTFSSFAQIGVQSPSIRENVTFQWSNIQDINNDGIISATENNRPATIESITVNGAVYNTFAVPSGYQLTRLGPGGNFINQIIENGNGLVYNSSSATQDTSDSNTWDDTALETFRSKNLNRYYTSNGNGDNICGNFNKANGINGAVETDAQIQTLIYSPALPSNEGGLLAVTERGGNNCFYIRLFGTLPGSTTEQPLGDTFVRSNGDNRGVGFAAPKNNNTDYWTSGREQDNDQDIAIALFNLNTIAPTGSKISKIRFISASRDDGDGKFFVLQRYAQPQIDLGCLGQGTFNGQIHNESSAPEGSTYELVSPPSPTGLNFNLNPDGSYTYTPTSNFVGDVTFKYLVRLPTPNNNITDTNTVTLTFNSLPEDPELEITCGSTTGKYNVEITSPIGSQYEYRADAFNGGAYQDSPDFENLTPGTYNFTIRDVMTGCESSSISTTITSETLKATIVSNTPVDCHGEATGSIDINVSGGYPPYTYLWSNGETTQDITGVPSGSYNVDITDDSGCLFTFATDVIVNEPKALTATAAQDSPVVCFGEANGSATVTPAGGNGNYTYSWDNGET
ncbi:Ig-like domain-containing protein, partial [Postechiella marina]|uniref:Ig-like domain-containing protein n=1 Tax=Postechiella marina TaxID=943941 RepID=UPI0031D25C99